MLRKLLENLRRRKPRAWLLGAGLLFAVGCSATADKAPTPNAPSESAAPASPVEEKNIRPDGNAVLKPDGDWSPDSNTPPPPPPIPEEYRDKNSE